MNIILFPHGLQLQEMANPASPQRILQVLLVVELNILAAMKRGHQPHPSDDFRNYNLVVRKKLYTIEKYALSTCSSNRKNQHKYNE